MYTYGLGQNTSEPYYNNAHSLHDSLLKLIKYMNVHIKSYKIIKTHEALILKHIKCIKNIQNHINTCTNRLKTRKNV